MRHLPQVGILQTIYWLIPGLDFSLADSSQWRFIVIVKTGLIIRVFEYGEA